MTEKKTLMAFPCEFQIKIIGDNKHLFFDEILTITRKHFPELDDRLVSTNISQKNNFLAITITIIATSQESLDALYHELTKHPDTRMVL